METFEANNVGNLINILELVPKVYFVAVGIILIV